MKPTIFKTSDKLPSRLKLLSWGRNESSSGPVTLDDESAAGFAAMQKTIGRERIALDFEHNTVPGTPEYNRTQEPRSIAAYGAPQIVDGQGLYLEEIEWTPLGEDSARNYEDLSPAPYLKNGRVVALHSAALTRTGAVFDLTLFTAQGPLAVELATLSAAIPGYHKSGLTGMQRAMAAHQRETQGQPEYVPAGTRLAPLSAEDQGKLVSLSGLNKSIAAHQLETRGQYPYHRPVVRPVTLSAAVREKFAHLKGLDLAIAVNNAENAGTFGFK